MSRQRERDRGLRTDSGNGDEIATPIVARRKHPLPGRWMHWVNFPLLLIMLWTGLRIYNANDVHAIDLLGLRFRFFPDPVFELLDANRRLAKGIAYHLTFGWLFAINGVAYGLYLAVSGRWRDIAPDRFTWREAPTVVALDLHLRSEPPPQGLYNAAQRLAYSAVIAMGAVMLVTGFAIYKPTQLAFLTTIVGGYETARLIHFTTSLLIVAFFGVHLLQVARAGWSNFASMITGYERENEEPDPAITTLETDERDDEAGCRRPAVDENERDDEAGRTQTAVDENERDDLEAGRRD